MMRARAMRRCLRAGALAAVISTLAVSLALADVVFGPNAQQQFGVDANGAATANGRTGEFPEALDAFRETTEGQFINGVLDNADVEVTIEVLPKDQVGKGKAYGTTEVTERDPKTGKPTKFLIKIRETQTGGVAELADTIHHEMRHAEEWMGQNKDNVHDGLDDQKDPANKRFQDQVKRELERREAEKLAEQARKLGDILGDTVDCQTGASIQTPLPPGTDIIGANIIVAPDGTTTFAVEFNGSFEDAFANGDVDFFSVVFFDPAFPLPAGPHGSLDAEGNYNLNFAPQNGGILFYGWDARPTGTYVHDPKLTPRGTVTIDGNSALITAPPDILPSYPVFLGMGVSAMGGCDNTELIDVPLGGSAGPGGDVDVRVLVLGGQAFPASQFILAGRDVCPEAHYHAPGTVFSLEGGSAVDPNPSGCGFGTKAAVPLETESVHRSAWNAYLVEIGLFAP